MNPPRTSRGYPRLAPPLLFVLCLAVLTAVRAAQRWHLPLPRCGLRTLTGIPCPTCGGTRSLMALSTLELGCAFQFNPLVALAGLGLCGWVALWLLDLCFHRDWAGRSFEWLRLALRPRLWPWPLAAAALINWVYLLLYLPR